MGSDPACVGVYKGVFIAVASDDITISVQFSAFD